MAAVQRAATASRFLRAIASILSASAFGVAESCQANRHPAFNTPIIHDLGQADVAPPSIHPKLQNPRRTRSTPD
ncbi:hypothetical protein C8Q78DRAFT_1027607 [Trametes maxima]|nr:hypothetical protein C8Q78DRAFT_1027607 [Trametes maxima]